MDRGRLRGAALHPWQLLMKQRMPGHCCKAFKVRARSGVAAMSSCFGHLPRPLRAAHNPPGRFERVLVIFVGLTAGTHYALMLLQ